MKELERLKNIEDEKERLDAFAKASKLIVEVAYDRAEVYDLLGFILIQSADTLFRASAEMLDTVKSNVKFNDRFKLNKAMKSLNEIITNFDIESQKIHDDYFKHGYVDDNEEMTPYDAIEHNSKVILHFVMLIYNALKKSKGNAQILQRSLTKLKGVGDDIFSLEEIASL